METEPTAGPTCLPPHCHLHLPLPSSIYTIPACICSMRYTRLSATMPRALRVARWPQPAAFLAARCGRCSRGSCAAWPFRVKRMPLRCDARHLPPGHATPAATSSARSSPQRHRRAHHPPAPTPGLPVSRRMAPPRFCRAAPPHHLAPHTSAILPVWSPSLPPSPHATPRFAHTTALTLFDLA